MFDDLEIPIWWQGLDEQGIVVEDDVWIGTHVVICDGVTVGAHSVLAAGSVVTKDVPPYSVVGGVPARVLYDRRDRPRTPARRDALAELDRRVAEQWRDVLDAVPHRRRARRRGLRRLARRAVEGAAHLRRGRDRRRLR